MLHISLKNLIQTGYFGPVRLGMSREEVLSSLGPPDDWSDVYQKASILKYGDVELHFGPTGDLWLIHLEDFNPPKGGKSLVLDPWVIRQPLSLAEMEGYLSGEGIRHEVRDWKHEKKAKCLVAGAGVQLLFTYGGDLLCGVSYSVHGRKLTER